MGDNNFKSFAVVNPHSAGGRTGREWPRMREAIRTALGPFDFALTGKPGEATGLSREALARGCEMIIAVGGDGTNHEVVNGFFEGEKPVSPEAVLAIFSSGTGGDLARTLGVRNLPLPLRAETLKGRDSSPADVGLVSFRDHRGLPNRRYFINLASLGIGGEVDRLVNLSSKRFGTRPAFLIAGIRVAAGYRNKLVRYRIDGGSFREEKVLSIYLALGEYAGGGMRFAPGSRPDDGFFDIIVAGDLSPLGALRYTLRAYKGEHLSLPRVARFRGRKLEVESHDRVSLDLDGENPGVLPAVFEIRPGMIRLKQLKRRV